MSVRSVGIQGLAHWRFKMENSMLVKNNVEETEQTVVICDVCPRQCELLNEQVGYCSAYEHIDGNLCYIGSDVFSAINIEPIEKKPFFHFYPGSMTVSIGHYGCNFSCAFCQNNEISQGKFNFSNIRQYEKQESIETVIERAKIKNVKAVVFTYNEPLIHLPFYKTIIKPLRDAGFKILFKTNGFFNERVFDEAVEIADGFNIDIKMVKSFRALGLSRNLYKEYFRCFFRNLKKVVTSKKHIEISALCFYNHNKSALLKNFSQILEISDIIPIHLLKYIQMPDCWIAAETTGDYVLAEWRSMLMENGFRYVYNGYPANVFNTHCQYCQAVVIERDKFIVTKKNYLFENGNVVCGSCKRTLPIIDLQ